MTATKAAAAAAVFAVYPNPATAGGGLHVQLAAAAPAASYTLRNVSGQTVATHAFSGAAADAPTDGLKAGTYVLSVQVGGQAPVARQVAVH